MRVSSFLYHKRQFYEMARNEILSRKAGLSKIHECEGLSPVKTLNTFKVSTQITQVVS